MELLLHPLPLVSPRSTLSLHSVLSKGVSLLCGHCVDGWGDCVCTCVHVCGCGVWVWVEVGVGGEKQRSTIVKY